MSHADPGWAQLDRRTILLRPVSTLVRLLPALAGVVFLGAQSGFQLYAAVAGAVLLIGVGFVAYATTRFRVTESHVELRSGLVVRRAKATPRDRVRTVEATAPPLHRLLGVVRVRIGTGTSSDSELELDAVSLTELETLRTALLHREHLDGTATPDSRTTDAHTTDHAPAAELITAWEPRWARYAPLSTSGIVALVAVVGVGFQVLQSLGLGRAGFGSVERLVTGTAVGLLVTLLVLAAATLSVVLAVAITVEGWWGGRLTRGSDGSLSVSRGLLTTRSVTVEQARLRGTTTLEPLLVRAARGVRLEAVVSGLSSGTGSSAALLPAAPRAEVTRVAAEVLGVAGPVHPPLRRHPAAAARRRLVRTGVPAAVVAGGLATAAILDTLAWWVALAVAGVVLAAAVLLGLDRATNLGHAVTAEHLVVREGSLVRRTTALRRTGVIGVTVRRSVFQRRAGLATVSATTAAGAGAFRVLDVDLSEGLATAETTVPGLLSPFTTSSPGDGAPAR